MFIIVAVLLSTTCDNLFEIAPKSALWPSILAIAPSMVAIAAVTCSQGGHYLTNQLLRKVFQNKENFSIIEIKEKNLPHTLINRNLLRSIA